MASPRGFGFGKPIIPVQPCLSIQILLKCKDSAFEKEAIINWLSRDKTSFAIFDAGGADNFRDEFRQLDNVIVSEQYAGFTVEAKQRPSEKVLGNLTGFFTKE